MAYLRVAQNSAHSQPIIDQPKIQLPNLMACISGLPLPFWRATHAGAINTLIVNRTASVYFIINKKLMSCNIFFLRKGGAFGCPPRFHSVMIINHTLRICPVLLRCELTGCILPYGLCVT